MPWFSHPVIPDVTRISPGGGSKHRNSTISINHCLHGSICHGALPPAGFNDSDAVISAICHFLDTTVQPEGLLRLLLRQTLPKHLHHPQPPLRFAQKGIQPGVRRSPRTALGFYRSSSGGKRDTGSLLIVRRMVQAFEGVMYEDKWKTRTQALKWRSCISLWLRMGECVFSVCHLN